MSIETILIIVLLFFGIFALATLTVVGAGIFLYFFGGKITREAVRNAKPSSINYGTVINNNYGQENEVESKFIDDETALLASKCLGEFTGQFAQSFKREKNEN